MRRICSMWGPREQVVCLIMIYKAPDGEGVATLRFYAGGQQLAERTGGIVTYLHQDHLGSTRLVTDSNGNKVFSSNYQPYGVDSGISGSEEFRYTGKPSDSTTGLYYFGARYYDPSIGRFITEDTAAASYSDPQSLNRYVYCRNNPHKYVDPDGRAIWVAFGIINAVANVAIYMATHSEWDYREMAVMGSVGFVTGAIGGGVAGNAVIKALSPIARIVVSAITTTLITAPVGTATEQVLDSALGNEQKTPEKVLEDLTVSSAYSAGGSAIFTVLPATANIRLDPILNEAVKTTTMKGAKALAQSYSTYQQREDRYWETTGTTVQNYD